MARTNATNFSGALQFPMASAGTDLFLKEDVQTLAKAVDGHDHTNGKGLPIPTGYITGGMIADGTITTADMADNAITTPKIADNTITGAKVQQYTLSWANMIQGSLYTHRQVVGATVSPSTTSTTAVQVPDMAITWTPTANCNLFIHYQMNVYVSVTGQWCPISIRVNGAVLVEHIYSSITAEGFTSSKTITMGTSHYRSDTSQVTIAVYWNTSGGTLTSDNVRRQLTVIEFRPQ